MRRPFSTIQRWPLVRDHAKTEGRSASRRVAAILVVLAVGATLALGQRLPVTARAATALLGSVLVLRLLVRRERAVGASEAWLEGDASGLSRVTPAGTDAIVKWGTPMGISLLASYGRPTALLAFTTGAATRYVPTRIDDRSEPDDETLSRIAVLADLDLVDGFTHEPALSTASAAALALLVERRDPGALGRALLSDAKGTPIAVDRATLAVGERTFDLTSALEWRPLMFHESTGQAAALYQATWVRQGSAEVVLVAPMPASIVPRDSQMQATGKLGRALTRDLRLLQAPAEPPPPRESRVAIDRPFMIAVRRALDDAPLAARVVLEPPSRPSPTRRDSVA